MTGIILAAGQGTRLRPYTDRLPKCMVPIWGQPLLSYILRVFKSCGMDRVIVVTGYCSHVIEGYVEGREVELVKNESFASTNMVYSLFCSEDVWAHDDLIISYADILYLPDVLEGLMRLSGGASIVVDEDWQSLWELRMEDPFADAESLRFIDNDKIKELGNPIQKASDAQGQYIGLIRFSKDLVPEIRNYYHGLNKSKMYRGKDFNNMYMTTFLQMLIDEVAPVHGLRIQGDWLEMDTKSDLELYEDSVDNRILSIKKAYGVQS